MAEKKLSDSRNKFDAERRSILKERAEAQKKRAEAQIRDYNKRQQDKRQQENSVVHGDSTGEPFSEDARVLYEDKLPGVVRFIHNIDVKNDIIPEGIYYTVELDDKSIAIAAPKSIRALRNDDIVLPSIPALGENINPISKRTYKEEYMNTIFKKREKLPMFNKKKEIQKLVNHDFKRIHEQIILIKGETGSGKTTQIPQFFVSDPRYVKEAKGNDKGKRIIVTVPKRLAARSTAQRVADELEVTLGQEVGYSVQNDIKKSIKTRIEFMTEGMLLMEMKNDPLLSRTSMIILDEVHERTVNLDLLIGLLTKLIYSKSRPELKCIFMSATLDEEKFKKYFQKQMMDRPSWAPPYLKVEGRSYAVKVFYSSIFVEDYIDEALEIILHIHKTKSKSNKQGILVFLPGKKDIEKACQTLKDLCHVQNINDLVVYPFYSSLSKPEQDIVTEVHDGETSRRVIISTNYAEASVTINGIVYVIDSGMMKKSDYDPKLKLLSLLPGPIDKAAAEQRKGRAGRTQNGYCYRMWRKDDYKPPMFEDTMTPPICKEDISQSVLTLINMGENPIQFGWMDSPSKEQFERAWENLTDLGAITNVSQFSKEELPKFGELTQLGKEMAQLPIKPEYAKILLKSPKHNCSKDALSLVACLYNGQIFKMVPPEEREKANKKKLLFTHYGSDHLTLLTAYKRYINIKKAINRFPTEPSEEELQSQNKELQDWCTEYYLNIEALIEIDKMRNKLKRIMQKILNDRVENSKEISSTEIDNLPLPEKLKKLGLKEFKIKPDGNCQFRAVSHQWYGNQEQHEEIRINACIQLLENPDIYKNFIWDPNNNFMQNNDGGFVTTDEHYKTWVNNMTKDSVYGDHVTLQAIANSYGMNIKVISEFINDRFFETNKNSTQTRTITLLHKSEENGIHYNSVEPISGFVVNNNLIKKSIEEKNKFDTFAQYDRYSNLKKCILEGCFAQVAYYNRSYDSKYIIVKDHTKATLGQGVQGFDPKKSRWVCFDKYSRNDSRVDSIFTCTVIDNPADLLKIAPEYYNIQKYPKKEGIIFKELKKLENSEQYATDEIEIKSESDEKLKQLNLLKINIKQDHDCQFAALSQQMYRDDTEQIQIRANICGEIIRNQKVYSKLYPSKDLNKYLDGYDCDLNFWGDELTLQAAADYYKKIISVIFFDDKDEVYHVDYTPTDIDPESFTSLPQIYLLRENKKNYYPIVRIKNDDSYEEDNDTVSYDPEKGSIESQPDFPNENVFTMNFPHTNLYNAGPLL
tara:strand:- start:208 stop:3987 length:3780 start_codon:yes stop_codon:yes gene_type:complete